MSSSEQSVNDREVLSKNRADWMNYLIDTRFEGSKEGFSEAIRYGLVTVNHFLNPHSNRRCGDKAARSIEKSLNLSRYTLDEPVKNEKEIYYVGISTNAQYTYETVLQLKNESCVQECSAVLGDFDILIKVEVESFKFLDILLAKLVKFPGVTKSQTLKAIESLHWQREQKPKMEIPPKEDHLYINNGVEAFIHKKMNHLFDQVKLLERDTITIKDDEPSRVGAYELLNGTKNSICAIRNYDSKMKGFTEFNDKEKKLIDSGINSRRIIILDSKGLWKKNGWSLVMKQYENYSGIGCNIKFLTENRWSSLGHKIGIEKFLILDSSFVCIREEETDKHDDEDYGQVIIYRSSEVIKNYKDTFEINWNKAHTYDELYSKTFSG